MAKNPLDTSNSGSSMPGVSPAMDEAAFDPSEFQYRIGRFIVNGGDDDTLRLEALLTRSITEDVIIVERKDTISAVTGDFICVIIYMEKRLHA